MGRLAKEVEWAGDMEPMGQKVGGGSPIKRGRTIAEVSRILKFYFLCENCQQVKGELVGCRLKGTIMYSAPWS